MRPIARQSARLATTNRASRSCAAIRQNCQQQRALHASAQRYEPRSPNSQPDHHTPFNERHEPHKRPENGTPRHEQATEEATAETKAINDSRKHGMKRNLRQKRLNDVPKPPPIPDWFLQHNVRLFKDSPGMAVNKETGQVIRCIDAETGHTLFTVPYYEAWPTAPPQEKREGGREKEKHSKHEQPRADDELNAIESASLSKHAQNKVKSSLEQNFFDHKYQLSEPTARQQQKETKKAAEFALPTNASQLESKSNSMRWVFLEAETSVRAALSLANENQRSSSFASDRVDLSLQCPDPNCHDQMDEFVRDLARIVQADVIRLDANDFAELAEDYVGQGHDEPGSFSTLGYDVFDGYQATALRSSHVRTQMEEDEENEMDEDEEVDEDEHDDIRGNNIGHFTSIGDLRKALQDGRIQLGNAIRARIVGIGIGFPQQSQRLALPQQSSRSSSVPQNSEMNRDDARLAALLDHLLDAPKQKRASNLYNEDASAEQRRSEQRKSASYRRTPNDQDKSYQRILRYWRSNPAFWLPQTAQSLVGYLGKAVQDTESGPSAFTLASEPRSSADGGNSTKDERPKTIVHIRDLRDLCNSRLGETIIHRLVKVIRKRRRSGEQIVIVGTTAQDVPGPFRLAGDQADDFPFRAITVPPFFNFSLADDSDFEVNSSPGAQKSLNDPAYRRILEINLRHLQSMLRRLRPDDHLNLLSVEARGQLNMPGMHFLTEKVLSLDQGQRLVLIAIGLSQSHAIADSVKPIHVALAGFTMTRSKHAELSWAAFRERKQARKSKSDFGSGFAKDGADGQSGEARIERLKKICNPHETRLLSGMVDPQNIKTAFADVHAPEETIEALKTLTTLSLLRPDAFKYGVLANDRLPGLLLYGPPGTGKTLLAKAVAKESKATVLEVSGAQIYEKYVGEGEKMVRAVFSLAKKLTPCVVFVDEADAIFGSRSNAGNRNTHREIINQFLREWDGMDDHGVFMMVASNRPFDLDDAVLRRLPRRLLVDLPVAKDRESILGIHLKYENLDPSVSLSKLAEQTPLYSGSDLKNLSVAAALACVREENELANAHKDEEDLKFPAKRTLALRHFEKALAEISASISEDMSSLTAIRKFDEQYGDRKGRRKKTGYGFGAEDGMVDEGAARVRQPTTSPPPP